ESEACRLARDTGWAAAGRVPGGARSDFRERVLERDGDLFFMATEEMVGFGDYLELRQGAEPLSERAQMVGRAVAVVVAGEQQDRLADRGEHRRFDHPDRQRYRHDRADLGLAARRAHRNHRAEGVTCDNRAVAAHSALRGEKANRRRGVVGLAVAVVELAFAPAEAAEVEAQGGATARVQCLEHRVHHVVVHRAAVQRMGMADDSGAMRPRAVRPREHSLQRELSRLERDSLFVHRCFSPARADAAAARITLLYYSVAQWTNR